MATPPQEDPRVVDGRLALSGQQQVIAHRREHFLPQLKGQKLSVRREGDRARIIFQRPVTWTDSRNRKSQSKATLLSWTTKMGALSWSLPAGSPANGFLGGTCPISAASMAADLKNRHSMPFAIDDYVCFGCYALKGEYVHGEPQLCQLARALWMRQGLKRGAESLFSGVKTAAQARAKAQELASDRNGFVAQMVENIQLDLANRKEIWERNSAGNIVGPQWLDNGMIMAGAEAYFRIHDSGDFENLNVFWHWFAISLLVEDVIFWAPVRQYALGDNWIAAFKKASKLNPRLILRPSALFVEHYQTAQGLPAGSMTKPLDPDDREAIAAYWRKPSGPERWYWEGKRGDRRSKIVAAGHVAENGGFPDLPDNPYKSEEPFTDDPFAGSVWVCPAALQMQGTCQWFQCRHCWTHPKLPVLYKWK